MDKQDLLTIGEVSTRSGLAPSALRHYESLGLITSTRTSGDRRRFARGVAYLKGLGTGLARDPAQDYLGEAETQHPRGWTTIDVTVPEGYAAAVSGRAGALTVDRRLLNVDAFDCAPYGR